MFPIDVWLAYTLASVLIVMAPGPDIALSIARGMSQGRLAAALSGLGAATGILLHSLAAAYGLALAVQGSSLAFLIIKIVGAGYLIWLGVKAILFRNLIVLTAAEKAPLHAIYGAGLMSNVLNPKIGLFVLAFIPQFVSADRGPVDLQTLVYGAWLAVIAALGLSLIGGLAAGLGRWLQAHPVSILGLNVGAGLVFVASGISALVARQR